jgi:hypothetical protein
MKTMSRINGWSRSLALLVAGWCLAASAARAQWTGNGSDNSYNNPDNWAGETVNDTFTGPYGWPSGSYTDIKLSGTRTLDGNFTYDNTDVTGGVRFNPDNDTVWNFSSDRPVFSVDMGPAGVGTGRNGQMWIGADSRTMTADFHGGNPVFDITPTLVGDDRDTVNWYVTINNAASLTKQGNGNLNIYRTVNVSGAVNISGAANRSNAMSLGGFNNAADTDRYGKINAAVLNIIGVQKVLNLQPTQYQDDMLGTTMPVNLYNGALGLSGASQAVGPVNIYGRAVVGNLSGADDVTLTLASLTRHNFATFNLIGNNQGGRSLGVHNFIKIAAGDAYIIDSLVGDGPAGSTTVGIVPWITSQGGNGSGIGNTDNSQWMGGNLVTYTTAGGFRQLADNEYHTKTGTNNGTVIGPAVSLDDITDGENVSLAVVNTSTNVYTGTFAMSGDRTFNALRAFSGSGFYNGQPNLGGGNYTVLVGAGNTLTLTSGVITVSNNTTTFTGGVINTGVNPLIISGRTNITINSDLTNSITDRDTPGFIAAAGNIYVSGNNTYGGMTLVQGNLIVNSTGALPTATELRLDREGVANIFAVSTIRQLSGIGTLNFTNNVGLNVGGVIPAGNRGIAVSGGGSVAPGDLSGDYQAGTLLLGANVVNLAFYEDSTFAVDISATGNDMVQALASAATLNIMGGTLELTYLDGYDPAAGTSWLLTSGFTASSGLVDGYFMSVLDLAHADWEYTLSFSNNNLMLTLDTIPEPSTWLLLGVGVMLLALLRRARCKV